MSLPAPRPLPSPGDEVPRSTPTAHTAPPLPLPSLEPPPAAYAGCSVEAPIHEQMLLQPGTLEALLREEYMGTVHELQRCGVRITLAPESTAGRQRAVHLSGDAMLVRAARARIERFECTPERLSAGEALRRYYGQYFESAGLAYRRPMPRWQDATDREIEKRGLSQQQSI